jgi:hypothetical protein
MMRRVALANIANIAQNFKEGLPFTPDDEPGAEGQDRASSSGTP